MEFDDEGCFFLLKTMFNNSENTSQEKTDMQRLQIFKF